MIRLRSSGDLSSAALPLGKVFLVPNALPGARDALFRSPSPDELPVGGAQGGVTVRTIVPASDAACAFAYRDCS